jgi:hypothetical protein
MSENLGNSGAGCIVTFRLILAAGSLSLWRLPAAVVLVGHRLNILAGQRRYSALGPVFLAMKRAVNIGNCWYFGL